MVIIKKENYEQIALAIREKTATEETLKPENMAKSISDMTISTPDIVFNEYWMITDNREEVRSRSYTSIYHPISVIVFGPKVKKMSSGIASNTAIEFIFIPSTVAEIAGFFSSAAQSLTIYTDAAEKPDGWAENFNQYYSDSSRTDFATVNYGVSLNEFTDFVKTEFGG